MTLKSHKNSILINTDMLQQPRFFRFGIILVGLLLGATVFFWLWSTTPSSIFNRTELYRSWFERIRETRIVPIGYIKWHYPFSYARDNKGPMGFSVDFTKLLVKALESKMALGPLQIQWVPMFLSENEQKTFPALERREVAFECNTTLALSDHPKAVTLSNPFFISSVHILSSIHRPIRTIEDIRNKVLISHEGVFQRWAFKHLNDQLKLNVGLIPAPIIQSSAIMLDQGLSIGILGDALRLFNVLYAVPNPNQWVAGVNTLGTLGYACSILNTEVELNQWLNESITTVLKSKDYQQLYHRWFIAPQPDWNMTLNYPMPKALQSLIKMQGGIIDPSLVEMNKPMPSPPPLSSHPLSSSSYSSSPSSFKK